MGLKAKEPLLTVGIFADLDKGIGGGVSQFTEGLITSLLGQWERNLRLVIFLSENNDEWPIEPSELVSIVVVRKEQTPQGWRKWLNRITRYGAALSQASVGNLLQARVTISRRSRQRTILDAVRRSPWELDVLHFPFQDIVPLKAPLIFSPWDLQHLHLKDLWPKSVAKARDAYYRTGCRLASCVVLASEWAREDVIGQYGVPRSKTAVVRLAPPTRLASKITPKYCADLRRKHDLPRRFLFYPAIPWKHKNHIRLLTALAKVNQTSQLDLHLVCCGQYGRYLEEIMAHAEGVGVRDHVRFLGHIERREVRGLYRLAEFCIYPTLFEGAGFPVLEAFEEGCPLAASGVTCIPEYAGDAALLFDPWDVESIADAIVRLASSEALRRELADRGRERATLYSWDNVAVEYISLYRRLAGRTGDGARGGA